MIGHVVVLFGFHHRPHLVLLDMVAQFNFGRTTRLYDRSYHCPVWSLQHTTPCSIGPNNLVLVLV